MATVLNMSVLKLACGIEIRTTDERGLKKREQLHATKCDICKQNRNKYPDRKMILDVPKEDPIKALKQAEILFYNRAL